ncbi:MAG TPA: 4-alpha-glucanotransferase [Thermoanaerobaculia bacterium]
MPPPDARAAGILLHPTSLPGSFGIGDLGPGADRFLDWAAEGGQSLWQVLPLGPTGGGHSPYTSASAFAGNPLLISPESLVEEDLLGRDALWHAPGFPPGRVDFASVKAWKETLLRESWDCFGRRAPASLRDAFAAFAGAAAQLPWLEDWARFAALKVRHGGRAWTDWGPDLAFRHADTLGAADAELADEIAFHRYVQFLFFRQWERVRAAAAARGISLVGDIPIYAAHDSADVWAHQDLFELDGTGRPTAVAGVPPDYFSATGQLWGNPLYRWDRLEEEGYAWWIERIRSCLARCDLLRIDHFRAFSAYWSVPAVERTALAGRWIPGPGRRLFDAAAAALGPLPILAEDLGDIDADVRALLGVLGFPGMKVLQFGFYGADSEYLPHRHVPNAVVYTGTHDNDTARGWYEALTPEERERVWDYLGCDGRDVEWALIRAAYGSVATRAIVPLQDVLGLGSEARMNKPSEPANNWGWRAAADALKPELAGRLRRMVALTGRLPVRPSPWIGERHPDGG